MLIGVLALQGDVTEHEHALAELGVHTRRVRRPADLEGIDGIVLPGGESTTISMLLESSGLGDPLAEELETGLPAFGTCAGMILLAGAVSDGRPDQRCFGVIDLVVRRNGYGRQLDSFEYDLQVDSLGEAPVHAIFIRAPVVEATGQSVEVLAELQGPRELQGVRDLSARSRGTVEIGEGRCSTPVICRQGTVLVTAFHPELTADRRLHGLFVEMVEQRGSPLTERRVLSGGSVRNNRAG